MFYSDKLTEQGKESKILSFGLFTHYLKLWMWEKNIQLK